MQQFYAVQNFLQGLIMYIIDLSNGFSQVLRLLKSLVTIISDTAKIFNVGISEVLTICVQHDLYIVLHSAATTFK